MFALWREDSAVRPLDHLQTSPSIMTFHHPLQIITLWYRGCGSGVSSRASPANEGELIKQSPSSCR